MNNKVYLAALLAVPVCALAQTNLVVNGSFEDPGVSNNSFQDFNSLPGWTATAQIEVRNNRIGQAYAGKDFAELDVNGKANSTISQTISTVAGQWYQFDFYYSNRPFVSVSDSSTVPASSSGLSWSFADASGMAPVLPKVTDGKNDWNEFSVLVQASGSSSVLSIGALGTVDGLGSSLDAVSVVAVSAPVPEPGSYALLAGGLGVMAFVARRRRA